MKPPPPTAHQIARRRLWARLWLEALSRFLQAGGAPFIALIEEAVRARVCEMRLIVLNLIFFQASRRPAARRLAKFGHSQAKNKFSQGARRLVTPRMVAGGRLWRASRARDLRAQVEALLTLMRDPEEAILRVARRLKRGMRPPSRKFKITPAPLAHVCAPALVGAFNTS